MQPTYHIGILDFAIDSLLDFPRDNSWLVWSALAIDGSKCFPPVESRDIKFFSNVLNIIIISLTDFEAQRVSVSSAAEKFTWLFSNLGKAKGEIPEWATDNVCYKRVLDSMVSENLNQRESSAYHDELNRRKDLNENLETMKLESEVKAFMKLASKFNSKPEAYDLAMEEYGNFAASVLGKRPET